MKLPATLNSIAALAGAFLLAAALGASPAAAQQDVKVSIADREVASGNSTVIPVRVKDFNNIGSLTFRIDYDPQALSFGGTDASKSDIIASGEVDAADFNVNIPQEGRIEISSIANSALDIGNGVLLKFTPTFMGSSGSSTDFTFDAANSSVSDENADPVGASFLDGVAGTDLSAVEVDRVVDRATGQVTVSLSVRQDISGVENADFQLSFNTSALTYDGTFTNQSNLNLSVGEPTDGELSISGFSGSGGAVTLSGDVVDITFSFAGGASSLEFFPENKLVDANDNRIPAELFDGVVTEEAGVSVQEGGPDGLGQPFSSTAGQNSQPIGVVRLQTTGSGASLTSLEIVSNASSGASGVQEVALWSSSDGSFDGTDGDTEIDAQSLSGSLPSTVTFDGFTEGLPSNSDEYFYVTVDLANDATGSAEPVVASESGLGLSGGVIDVVNGSTQGTFTNLQLSSGSSSLPVELAKFEAVRTGSSARLSWSTASETGNSGFRVQHSPAGQEGWSQLGFVDSKAEGGTTTESKSYSYTVGQDLEAGTHRFRLKQVDLDGTTSLSRAVRIEIQMDEKVALTAPSPNPAKERATVSFGLKEASNAEVAVYNVLGQRVKTLYEGTPKAGQTKSLSFDTSGLPSGAYFVRLQANGQTETTRLTVVR